MKYTNYRCLLLLVCFAALFNSFPAFGQKNWLDLKILSYNIHHANPPSLPNTINTDTIGGLINKYQPDLVALQEVDVNTSRSGRSLDEAKAIADKSGMYFRFAKAIDYAGGEYGIAILSKYPFDSFNVFRLPSVNTGPKQESLPSVTFILAKGHSVSPALTWMQKAITAAG
ncbi:MAG: endonuclease/exonuclease/phosphatase family protein [Flavisolibacter sp.]